MTNTKTLVFMRLLPFVCIIPQGHTFATRCFELNVNIKTVQYLLGHSSAETTMDIYTHISTEQAKKEIQAVNTLDLTMA
ncbi:MAG: tyrosine-type recombinase/integrase [Firmicutes bacterium]|nr:tyrosine-type recombinase/integrase [Bacillota bacterium]